ncbi:patatin-like phospholipase family protein [Roseateles sp.]|uniref:patatin-like phospholipase family protein n=1 Tax=Roseateles sp. TaxID=1971397 RepID=UPI0039E783EE
MRPLAWALAAALALTGCSTAHYAVNPELKKVDGRSGYRLQRFVALNPDDSLMLHVSFSGGGLRAATLGLGVLDELRDTRIKWEGVEERLFDQIDIVMGLSGGSMLTAALAMGGEEGLARFEEALLQGSPQSDFVHGLMKPSNLWRLSSRNFGRTDALERFLDDRLFHGATFEDLARSPKKPFAVIYASDMVTGARFEFVQEQFDFLCSDLGGVHLARAVAASSAVPLVLSPVTLWNYSSKAADKGCGEPQLHTAAQLTQRTSRRLVELEAYREHDDSGLRRPFIHLIDGGLADNVGARGPTDYIGQFGGIIHGARFAGYHRVRRVIFIVVNAETSARTPEDASPHVPGPLRTALALADIPINRNSDIALNQMRSMQQAWRDEVREAQARGDAAPFEKDIQFHLIEVSLEAPGDPLLTEKLRSIPTNLALSPEDIALLREHGRRRLRQSPEFAAMVEGLKN